MLTTFTSFATGVEAMSSVATKAEIERFNSRWLKKGDCHIWQGYLDRDGYGQIGFRRAPRRAHRVALFLAGVVIPENHVVNHTCRNRACVNPQHLQIILQSENWKRDSNSVGYVNSQKMHCPRGHAYDRIYGNHRYCSICEAAKSKRLRAKWKAAGIFRI